MSDLRSRVTSAFFALALAPALVPLAAASAQQDKPKATAATVSFHKQVAPIFRAHCQGCHQPSKAGGGYVMTDMARLKMAGDSKEAPIVAGKPDESYLVDQITVHDGKAEMPKGKPPLAESDIDLIRQWIAQGAADDTPPHLAKTYDAKNPPAYARPVTVTSVDFAPDGKTLAVAGFHETLLIDAATGMIGKRLIGLAERIESVRFSPDGTKLAVAAGTPARSGELQIWDVASGKLTLSVPVGFDTIYGASWSPDGTKVAVGCADNSVRAFDAKTGEQILFQGAHNDWVRDTVFSVDGSHLVSVGRDMTAKLTEVATQRFVDNITSITPGALKGGILAVARHPKRDEIVMAGSDSVVKVYRMQRLTARVIGDDANQIRHMPAMTGRVWGIDVSADGTRIAAVSSLDGKGQLAIYGYEFDTGLPEDIKAIVAKTGKSPEEAKKLEEYLTKDVKVVSTFATPSTGMYAVSFAPDGKSVAVAGADGLIRIVETATGKELRAIPANPALVPPDVAAARAAEESVVYGRVKPAVSAEKSPADAEIVSLSVDPKELALAGPLDYAQMVVIGRTQSGETFDATRLVKVSQPQGKELVDFAPTGLVTPKGDGSGELTIALGSQSVKVPVRVADCKKTPKVDYLRDVTPVMSRLGCNQGTCHGSLAGKNGFKLSLRGYDAIYDVRALTDDLAGRRVNPVSPDNSLMLQKASGRVPHVGGTLTEPGMADYEVLRSWISAGAPLDMSTPKVTAIDIYPKDPIVQREGDRQQFRILAKYADGRVKDVTLEAFVESANTEVATAQPRGGMLTAIRRGEAPVLARFEGSYVATTMTVMGDRTGFAWKEPETWSEIDRLVAAKWQRMKIEPSGLADSTTFLRRIRIDLTGLPPTAQEVDAFLKDTRPTREKRAAYIESLIGSKDFVEYWTNKWADLLQVNRKFLAPEGAAAFRQWIRDQVDKNVPYDRFVKSVITASGSTKDNPAANYFKILRTPEATMENTTHLFLSIRFNCNKCHDHPFERWTQDQYYQTAAFFARTGLEGDPASGGKTIGGSAVEGATPLYEIVKDKADGEVKHDRTGQLTPPQFPYQVRKKAKGSSSNSKPDAAVVQASAKAEAAPPAPAGDAAKAQAQSQASRRESLAAWITDPDNEYFARSYVNRLWGYMFGVGLIEPIDDLRAGNPPTNPELLDYLTQEFVSSNFDVRHMIRLIANSRTYQLDFKANKWNEDDRTNYSHAVPRRLPAEVLYDAIMTVTGSQSKIPGVPPGTRAAELPDNGVELPSGFLNTFGRPVRESACECERTSGMQLGPVMALVSGPTLAEAISDPANALAKLTAETKDDRQLVDAIFLRVLNRPATATEIDSVLKLLGEIDADHAALTSKLAKAEADWVPVKAKLEKERTDRIAAAEKAVADRTAIAEPLRVKAEEERTKKIAAAEAAVKDYDAKIPQKLAAWEKQQGTVEWIPLRPLAFERTPGAQFIPQEDRSVFVKGRPDSGDYKFTIRTNLQNVTALRLEALSDDRLPSKGPGVADNGNFVVQEVQVTAVSVKDSKVRKELQFVKAMADFAQNSFSAAALFDKNLANNNGWAVHPSTGVTHWLTFESAEPFGFEGGTELQVTLVQRFGQKHNLGRFRLSVAVGQKDVGLTLPEDLATIVGTMPPQRTPQQKEAIARYFRQIDPEGQKVQAALADARKPVPPDAELVALKAKLEAAKAVVADDPKLVQLREDAKQSTAQNANKRLTVAQDLAWALINSPAFLFNH